MIPYWLYDALAAAIADDSELREQLTAWNELLADSDELDPRHEYGDAPSIPCRTRDESVADGFDLKRYRELRARGVGAAAFYEQCRPDFWAPTVPMPAPDETYYVRPATAARITGLSTSRLAALRRRGKVRSIGLTAGEYKRARQLAGWGEDAGWGPGIWYLREDVERIAREGRRAA